ncbi:MAG: hypothetical protein ACO3GN_03390 [Bacteroidia bacterium]
MSHKGKWTIVYFVMVLFLSCPNRVLSQNNLPEPAVFYDSIQSVGFRNPIVMYQLAMWESANLRSHLAKERANLFGLRGRSGYLRFENWMHCLRYMKNLEERKYSAYPNKAKNDYYDFIAWWGYKTGRSYDPREFGFVQIIKKVPAPAN